ncbi:MAG: HAD family phosphatase [Spirochaetales bacterium]|nr:HAD family phosphatase [Spirochaetales bacterium]
MKKKYILWDNDGVLVDTEPWYFEANKSALSELDISLTREEYMHFMQTGTSVWTIAEQKGIEPSRIAVQRKKRNQYYQYFIETKDINIPGVTDILTELSKLYSMAIVTTSKKEDFLLIHKDRHILQYMDFYLAGGDYARSKPAPDPYLAAMARFHAAADECIVIEDSARGLQSAIAAGIDCIIVRNEFTATHDFSGAYKIIDSLRDLSRELSKW